MQHTWKAYDIFQEKNIDGIRVDLATLYIHRLYNTMKQ